MALPAYALKIQVDRRIKYHCRASCRETVYGELNFDKQEANDKLREIQKDENSEEPVGISVKCGKCSYEQGDWYNWASEFLQKT